MNSKIAIVILALLFHWQGRKNVFTIQISETKEVEDFLLDRHATICCGADKHVDPANDLSLMRASSDNQRQ